jgi:hypothetical protein
MNESPSANRVITPRFSITQHGDRILLAVLSGNAVYANLVFDAAIRQALSKAMHEAAEIDHKTKQRERLQRQHGDYIAERQASREKWIASFSNGDSEANDS